MESLGYKVHNFGSGVAVCFPPGPTTCSVKLALNYMPESFLELPLYG